MSQENVEIVRHVYEAWNRGDLDVAFARFEADVEVITPPDLPEAGTYRGPAAVREWAETFLEAWGELRMDPVRIVDAEQQVVVTLRYSGRGRGSGLEVRGVTVDAHVWTLRDGRVVKLQMYQGTDEALEAAGLRE